MRGVPELPDITVYLEALAPRTIGRTLVRARVGGPSLLRTAEPPLAAAEETKVRGLRRLGKRIAFELDDELFLVIHLMVAGRLHWKRPGAALGRKTGLAAFDFADGSLVLTEAGTKRRASLHVLRGENALAEHDPGGLEVPEAE
jgi:formamidopyrimidine-DNA glycosylase